MEDILHNLNPAQKEAVTWPVDKPLLVLAGAGSGKTRILTRRIAYIVSQGIPAFNLLGVTFTNKAAEEMRRRVNTLVRQEVWVSTFHSTCLRILREDIAALDFPKNFVIYDEQDQLVLIKECLKEMNIPDRKVHPKGVRELIQRSKDYLLSPYQFLEKTTDPYEEIAGQVYAKYEKKLARLGGLDFGDLIFKTVFLFDRHPKILDAWQNRLRYILIDEYQDTNHAQYRLVKQLSSKYKQVTVVGDPDQSIYGWRGADIRNILNFEQDYAATGVIKMEQNYRSTTTILDAANALIQHNEYRKPKLLWGEKGRGDPIVLFEAGDEKEEAEFVVREILEQQKAGKTLADMAVFYRVHAQSRVFEDVLRKKKIPYKIVGGVRFYDRKEIKDLMAYLRATAIPKDDVGLKRIVNVPSRGIGKKALELLGDFAREKNLGFDEALRRAKEAGEIGPKALRAINQFVAMMEDFRKLVSKVSIRQLLQKVVERTEYVKVLEDERTVEAQARIENIEEFFSVVDDFEEHEHRGDLLGFIESLCLMTDLDTWEAGSNYLTLMTLHCAKGLEFPLVFMVGMENGIFPNVNAYDEDIDEELEEERRLCYVGITRSQEKLFMTYATSRRIYGKLMQNLPSRFLMEIPTELLDSRSGFGYRAVEEEFKSPEVEIDYDFSDDN